MAKNEKISFMSFQKRFSTEEACREHLFQQRWPNGFVCPKCGGVGCYPIKGRNEYVCKQCRRQTSVTAGTVMHRTHLSLVIWFWAIYLVANDKRGYSAKQLSRELEITYKSAWYLLHRIRKAMSERDEKYVLSGAVVVDEAFYGATEEGGKRGRGTAKTSVVVALSQDKNGNPLFLNMKAVTINSENLKAFLASSVQKGATVITDGLKLYDGVLREDYSHEVHLSKSDPKPLAWIHTVISNFKASFQGTYHGLGKKYIQPYLDEFCYRFNRKRWHKELFSRLLSAVVNSNILGLADLKG